MISIIFFTHDWPSVMAEGLAARGVACHEARTISEVFHLCKHTTINLVVVDASVDDESVKAVQRRFPTLQLQAEAAIQDVIWEITNVLGKTATVQ